MHIQVGTTCLDAETCVQFRRRWRHAPDGQTTLTSLQAMDIVITAWENDTVIGFVCGFSDHQLIAYVWDMEVLDLQAQARIESVLLDAFLKQCLPIYQINAHPAIGNRQCFIDHGFVAYEANEALAMTRMDYQRQAGK